MLIKGIEGIRKGYQVQLEIMISLRVRRGCGYQVG